MLKQYRIRDYDFKLVLLVISLTVIGIFAVGSAKESMQKTQIAGFILGLFLMLVLSLFDYSVLLKLNWLFYIGNFVLLALVAVMGETKNGAQRWIELFGIEFQPSETAKILLILFYAQFIMKHKERLNTFKNIGICCILILPPLAFIFKQPNLSTTIVLAVVFCVIMFVGGLHWKIVSSVLAVIVPVFVITLTIILQPDQSLIRGYQQTRILAWLHPEEYATTEAYQQLNSIMAIGSGQLEGKGYKTNVISSVKNGNFISEPQTDFIFAVIGEEFGFVGTCTVIILVILITLECLLVARRAKDLAGSIIAAGMAGLIGFQGFLNIGVTTGLLPNTGVTLPFVSYGLTSLLSLYIGIGFVLNVGLQCKSKY
ncbi:FtsW/RodA/SpoVE family cell cycle protein [Kineothrix sp. MB12-C1]|uniref:FtsW/RodA/SpoVE family cell cycle protein n=1 Tax=Kineothrix sp. MB12-C1 TaxID=3070215 RepID=UPI0027D30186|nr:FtsW/RodA/SpoVE family cell cycle protein [Kineothrix sp. MB12-C1]WMC92767.1 FtsW/RodA/SpoVE family cell cycle protein [Kineothrix sp. MB12-C1]